MSSSLFTFKKISLAVVILMIGYLCYHHYHHPNTISKAPTEAPVVVSTQVANNQDWHAAIRAVGNVKAAQSIQVSNEVAGLITEIDFVSGQKVQQGQVLLRLRADGATAALEKAQAQLAEDQNNYDRFHTLLAKQYISLSEMDNALDKVKQDQAEVKAQQAIVSQHIITAPFAGTVGIKQIELGQYIAPGTTLVNLEALDPVYVDFAVPERWLNRVKVGQRIAITADAFPDATFTGKVIATANTIDMDNRSLMIRAEVPNPDKKLLSGMSVNVNLTDTTPAQIVLPQSALAYTPEGVGVYTVDNQSVAHWHLVQLGARQDNDVVVLKGINNHDTVVIAGQLKLHEGAKVIVNNDNIL